MMISAESPKDAETVAVPAAESLEPFFTPEQGAWAEGGTSFSGTLQRPRHPRLCLGEAYAA